MVSNKTLVGLVRKVDVILREELGKSNIECDMAEARMWDAKSVGVVGDERAYGYIAEITLYQKDNFVWDTEFNRRLSSRITNEVKEVGRVVYLIGFK